MVLFTPEKLIFKGSKKQHQILAQTAYYQAGKIVVQTILPEQPPVALITLNTLGTTCSTSADTYIPIENIFNTQSCSSLESRLVSLYGGKAASLLIEYEQRLKFLNKNNNSGPSKKGLTKQSSPSATLYPVRSKRVQKKAPTGYGAILFQQGQKLTKQKIGKRSQANRKTKLINDVVYPIPSAKQKVHFSGGVSVRSQIFKRICFAGAGNNIFQSTLGNIEIQTATRLARIMVNYWNFYSLNKTSLYSLVNKYASAPAHNSLTQFFRRNFERNFFGVAVHRKTSINSINKLENFSNSSSNDSSFNDSSFGALRAVARERILPYKSMICKASARLELLRSSSSATLAPPTFYKSKNSFPTKMNPLPLSFARGTGFIFVEGYMEDLHEINNLESKNCDQTESLDGIVYPVKGKTFHTNNVNGIANRKFASLFTSGQQLKDQKQKDSFYILKEESVAKKLEVEGDAKRKCHVRVWGIKLKVKDKTPQGNIIYKYKTAKLNSGYPLPPTKMNPLPRAKLRGMGIAKRSFAYPCTPPGYGVRGTQIHFSGALQTQYPNGFSSVGGMQIKDLHGVCEARNNLYFAIAQSKNSLKICENKNSSYNIQRLSIENIGNYSQLNNNNFQLINSLQFSHLQRDRFYPNWFRLYLPDMEATEFLKNIANYYFSLGLQTLTFPSTKSSYSLPIPNNGALGKLNVNTASPFLSFLNKNTQKEKYKLFIPNISSYTYCPPTILINSPSVKSIKLRHKLTPPTKMNPSYDKSSRRRFTNRRFVTPVPLRGMGSATAFKESPFISVGVKGYANRRFANPLPYANLLLESQIFPLNYNGFSIVEKELLYNTLVNSSFAKAFYLINQNRQLLDFFVDYLLRFQILRQHQILYLFSTLLFGCNKIA